jgi:hypothetical protein
MKMLTLCQPERGTGRRNLRVEAQPRHQRTSPSPSPQPSPLGRGSRQGRPSESPSAAASPTVRRRFSLSPRERVGVRGNGPYELNQHAVESKTPLMSSEHGRTPPRPISTGRQSGGTAASGPDHFCMFNSRCLSL